MIYKWSLLTSLVIFTPVGRATEHEPKPPFHEKVIDDAKILAHQSGTFLEKPYSFLGAIPGAALGFMSAIPIAVASSAVMPIIHLGSGDIAAAGKSIVLAPLQTLYFGGSKGAEYVMSITGASGYIAGASLGATAAIVKNTIEYSGVFPFNRESANEQLPTFQSKYHRTIKTNKYLTACEQPLLDFVEKKLADSLDPIIIEQEWQYTVALAHDCLLTQYRSFLGEYDHQLLVSSQLEASKKIKDYQNKISHLEAYKQNTQARIDTYGASPRLQDMMQANENRLEITKSKLEEIVEQEAKNQTETEILKSMEGELMEIKDLILHELKQSGINQSSKWPTPLYHSN